MTAREDRLAKCLRLLEETDDVERCLRLYPDLKEELSAHLKAIETLALIGPDEPSAVQKAASRSLTLSSLSREPGGQVMQLGWLSGRAFGALAAIVLMAAGAVGAGAAGGGGLNGTGLVNDVLSQVGFVEKAQNENNHGPGVREKVGDAIASSTPGPNRGQAVSEAACEAAHNRETLPTPAQGAPGQEGRATKDCSGTESSPTGPANNSNGSSERGGAVKDGVQGAIASSTPGPERGQSVSQAACNATQDPSTLPAQAQNAGGQSGAGQKTCDHPNADGTPGIGGGASPGGLSSDLPSQQQTQPGGKPATVPTGGPPVNRPGPNRP